MMRILVTVRVCYGRMLQKTAAHEIQAIYPRMTHTNYTLGFVWFLNGFAYDIAWTWTM